MAFRHVSNGNDLYVGYLWARSEYFQARLVKQPILVVVTLVPDTTRQALWIPLINYSSSTLPVSQKPKPTKNHHKLQTKLDQFVSMPIPSQTLLVPSRVYLVQPGISNGSLGVGIDTSQSKFSRSLWLFLVVFGG